jgi:GTPase SAR1 family protein
MPTVALVGGDGAGKSTIAREVARRLGDRGRYLYMGINSEASNLMLPSTRLILEIKRRTGGRPDLAPPRVAANGHAPVSGRRGALARLKTDLRFANQIAEEWFRQLAAWYHLRQGAIVIFDRHFVWDYHASFTARGSQHGSVMRKWHDEL